jgi:hypothetical protein
VTIIFSKFETKRYELNYIKYGLGQILCGFSTKTSGHTESDATQKQKQALHNLVIIPLLQDSEGKK